MLFWDLAIACYQPLLCLFQTKPGIIPFNEPPIQNNICAKYCFTLFMNVFKYFSVSGNTGILVPIGRVGNISHLFIIGVRGICVNIFSGTSIQLCLYLLRQYFVKLLMQRQSTRGIRTAVIYSQLNNDINPLHPWLMGQ